MSVRLVIALLPVLLPLAAQAQAVTALATFNNIGIEVALTSSPPAGTAVNVAVKKSADPGDHRDAHPLARVAPDRFAGSVLQVEAGTAYSIRLSSPAFASNLLVEVTTRSEVFPPATNRTRHVAVTGDDTNDGLSFSNAFRTLGRALTGVQAGDRIVLYDGRYGEGDHEIYTSGRADAPIVIEAAPGARPVLDGTDTNFAPSWTLYDAAHQLYRTACTSQPQNAYLNGGQFYHYNDLEDLRTNRWGQSTGYHADGAYLYARFGGGDPPSTNTVTIPCRSTALQLVNVKHFQLRGLTFCYYGRSLYHKAVYLYMADSNVVEDCTFHHNGVSVGIKYDADHNLVQRCAFDESPADVFAWSAVKNGDTDYESGGVVVYGSSQTNSGNVIRFNRFEHLFDGAHLYSELDDGPTKHMDFHGNIVLHCGDDALETDGVGSNNRIYNNVFRDFLTGISVAPAALGPTYIFRNVLADWHPAEIYEGYPFKFNHSAHDPPSIAWVYLYHNTCLTEVPGQDGFLFKSYSGWTNVISRNNLYAGTSYALESWSTQNPVDFDYDALYTTNATRLVRWAGVNYGTVAAFYAATGQEEHGASAPPGLVDAAGGDFRPRSDSLLVDRGVAVPGINDDYAGAAPDIGAFEFVQHATAISTAGGGIVSGWNVVSGTVYQLQASADLVLGPWTNVGTASAATNCAVSLMDPSPQGARGFYRAVLAD